MIVCKFCEPVFLFINLFFLSIFWIFFTCIHVAVHFLVVSLFEYFCLQSEGVYTGLLNIKCHWKHTGKIVEFLVFCR